LWQKEQRSGSSGLNFFTGVKASSPPDGNYGRVPITNILGRILFGVKQKGVGVANILERYKPREPGLPTNANAD
jgi:hypothetical protein